MSLTSDDAPLAEKGNSTAVLFAENVLKKEKRDMSNSRSATIVAVLGLITALIALVMVVIVYALPHSRDKLGMGPDKDQGMGMGMARGMGMEDMDGMEMMTMKAEKKMKDMKDLKDGVVDKMKTEMSAMLKKLHTELINEERADKMERKRMMEGYYTFAYSADWKPQYYVDQNGFLKGQGLDMMKEICKIENKNCTHVVNYDGSTCWNSMKRNAPGLQGRWFDGCVGFIKTVDRSNVFGIVGSMYEPVKGAFFAKVGANVDIATARIGFDRSYYTNPVCLMRKGVAFDASKHVMEDSFTTLEKHLHDGSIDLIFAPEDKFPNLQKMPTTYDCAIGKGGVMVRKDMLPRMMWIHKGLEKMKKSGKFREMCENALRDHGAASICVSA